MSPSSNSSVASHRLSQLLGMRVLFRNGESAGFVNDVRLALPERARSIRAGLLVDGLVVDGRHSGSLLGYDRRGEQGPWLVRVLVRAIHRNAGYVSWDEVDRVDWRGCEVRLTVDQMQPLEAP